MQFSVEFLLIIFLQVSLHFTIAFCSIFPSGYLALQQIIFSFAALSLSSLFSSSPLFQIYPDPSLPCPFIFVSAYLLTLVL
jgi:hypothetical protein